MFHIGITDHLEGPAGQSSAQIYDEVQDLALLADSLGIDYFWFAEHHAYAHHGHLPAPLLLALHLAGRTRQIRLGTAIICLNLHHPLDVAEQIAIADELSGGRLSVGFGSGSTPQEFALFGLCETSDEERHARFAEALKIILQVWSGRVTERSSRFFDVPPHCVLPVARPDLHARSWLAVNSETSAKIAGKLGFGMLFSHLRTPEQYRQYTCMYRAAGGRGLIAANRPIYVGRTDAEAFRDVEPALRTLWHRFRDEGKIAPNVPEPRSSADLAAHPINFVIGGPESVARQLRELHAEVPFDVANLEVRWAGLSHEQVRQSLQGLGDVKSLLGCGQ